MTHPTDDELEAMAQYWDNSGLEYNPLEKADLTADMLRACKGRVRVKPLVWEQARDGAGWHPQLTIAYCPVFEKRFYAEHVEKQAKIDAAREARIMSALEPAPDHSDWNAAIEAAACYCESLRGLGYADASLTGPMSVGKAIAAAIRNLKKGPSND